MKVQMLTTMCGPESIVPDGNGIFPNQIVDITPDEVAQDMIARRYAVATDAVPVRRVRSADGGTIDQRIEIPKVRFPKAGNAPQAAKQSGDQQSEPSRLEKRQQAARRG
jgi:hypothetical protein